MMYSPDMLDDVANDFMEGRSLREICKMRGLQYEKTLKLLKNKGYNIKEIRYNNHSKCLKYKTKRTHEEYALICESRNIEVMEKYIGLNHKVTHKCKVCDYLWSPYPYNIINGSGCPRCSLKNNAKNRWTSHEEYVERLSVINPHLRLMEQHRGGQVKLLFSCIQCGYEWMKLQQCAIRGSGCPVCATGVYGKKVKLESGIWLDSLFEYRCYLEIKNLFGDDEIIIHKPYDDTLYTCDFYIIPYDLYIEVSLFKTKSYYERIYIKRKLVKNFFFVNNIKQIIPHIEEIYMNEEVNDMEV